MVDNELCFSSNCNFNKNPNFQLIPTVFFNDLSLLCSFIISHPLYFSYLVFFSPYLLKFVFYISPLFFTTTLLLLLPFLATAVPRQKLGFLRTVLEKLRSKLNDADEDGEFCNFEDFEIYKIVFRDSSLTEIGDGDDNVDDKVSITEAGTIPGNAVEVTAVEEAKLEEEKRLERLLEELDRFEDSTAVVEMKEKESRPDLDEVGELQKEEPVVMNNAGGGSVAEAMISGHSKKAVENPVAVKTSSWRLDSSSSLGSYGSMRKEKEWKRTLACKLFEERHNAEGGEEGMDSLWEAYETDHSSSKSKNRKEPMINQKKTVTRNNKKSGFKYFDHEDNDEEDDEDEFMSNGQLCCLKALRLSAGKMNLGMGKPNLVKISKALKGFGWLHHVSSKHGKKI